MAAVIRPLASAAVPGATIFSPGTFMKKASGFWLWKGPPWTPPPQGPRTTMGTPPPQRIAALGRVVHEQVEAQAMKSMNCISAMGRMPMREAPMAAPTMAVSLIGVSMTRALAELLEEARR